MSGLKRIVAGYGRSGGGGSESITFVAARKIKACNSRAKRAYGSLDRKGDPRCLHPVESESKESASAFRRPVSAEKATIVTCRVSCVKSRRHAEDVQRVVEGPKCNAQPRQDAEVAYRVNGRRDQEESETQGEFDLLPITSKECNRQW